MNSNPNPHPLGQPPQKRHPLEEAPRPAAPPPNAPRQRVTLHIPSVKPNATYVLIGLNVLIFVIRAISPAWDDSLFNWGANNQQLVLVQGEYYRLLSSMFLHAGLFDYLGHYNFTAALHILSNMYILYAVGSSLERLMGHARFLIVYLLGGLGGAVLSVLLGGADSYSVGASGAVFAIVAGEFVYLYHHRQLLGAAGRARRSSLIGFAVMNFAIGLVSALPGSAVVIDNWAHFGGMVGGLVLTWFISPILTLRAHPEHPGEILGEDTNPLNKRLWVVSAYGTVLVILLFIGSLLARR